VSHCSAISAAEAFDEGFEKVGRAMLRGCSNSVAILRMGVKVERERDREEV
jgi:hypothetical protein